MKYCDIRHMTKIAPIENALDTLDAMRPVTYEHNTGFGFSPRTCAIPAQDLETVPGAVMVDGIGNCTADGDAIVPYLVAAIKELRAELASVKATRSRRQSSETKA